MVRLLSLILILVFSIQNAQASEKDSTQDMYRAISDFAKGLNAEQTRHFYLLYNNFNLLKTVEVVREDISHAIESCSQNNPQIADKMQKSFKIWSGDVDPLVQQSHEKLESMITAQDYAAPEKIQALLALVDSTREETNREFNKVPVSTPEACEYLVTKMEGSQPNLVSMLNATLLDYPGTLPDENAQ